VATTVARTPARTRGSERTFGATVVGVDTEAMDAGTAGAGPGMAFAYA
jgi:hypothetical protein